MSSNLKVNTILPSTGTAIGIGTASGNVDVLGHIVGHNTPNISGINSVTATTFYGSGANLTSLPAANLTGTLPAISGANLTSLPAQATIANNADNRVITGGSGVNLNGEANLTFNGTLLHAKGSGEILRLETTASGGGQCYIDFDDETATRASIGMRGSSSDTLTLAALNGSMRFDVQNKTQALNIDSSGRLLVGQTSGSSPLCVSGTDPVIAELHHSDGGTNDQARISLGALANNPPSNRGVNLIGENNGNGHDFVVACSASHSAGPGEKARFKSGGDLSIADGNVVFASGHGIDFSATSGGSGGGSELLDDYEEGSFTATLSASGGGATFASGHIQTSCLYVKIGSMCHVQGYFSGTNVTGGGTGIVKVSGLPFASNNTTYYTICLTHNTMTAQQCTGAYIQYANTYFFPIQTGATSGSAFNVGNPRYLMFGGSYPVQF